MIGCLAGRDLLNAIIRVLIFEDLEEVLVTYNILDKSPELVSRRLDLHEPLEHCAWIL